MHMCHPLSPLFLTLRSLRLTFTEVPTHNFVAAMHGGVPYTKLSATH
jgi:hypothetical protein